MITSTTQATTTLKQYGGF